MTQEIKNTLEALGLTAEFKFVPFSQSRNKSEKHKSLNYIVTYLRNGKPFLTTDYSMGSGHAPKRPVRSSEVPYYSKGLDAKYIALVCESGVKCKAGWNDSYIPTKERILPKIEDIYYSLVTEASVLDYGGFEEWASVFGYNVDSRSAEKIYHACLEITLALRAAIGEEGMKQLQSVYQEY